MIEKSNKVKEKLNKKQIDRKNQQEKHMTSKILEFKISGYDKVVRRPSEFFQKLSKDEAQKYLEKLDKMTPMELNALSNKLQDPITKDEFYPICECSHLLTMPKNVHPSYIQAGIEVCEKIIEINQKENVKHAKKWLKKWK